jgi:hypothetical protein
MELPGLASAELNKLATVLPIDNHVTKTIISSPLERRRQQWFRNEVEFDQIEG